MKFSLGVITVVAAGGTTPYSGDGAMTETTGTYTYTVIDDNGCTAVTSTTLSEPSAINASANFTTPILCNGGTAATVVSGSGGQGPLYGVGTFQTPAGSYTYTLTDSVGCTGSVSGSISEPTALVVNISSSTIMCYGDSSTIAVSGSGATRSSTNVK